jgi:hypothetical protein
MRYRWDPAYPTRGRRMGLSIDTNLRASDAERNEVADRLSRHFADGRLDEAEFKARLDKAIGATTLGDLEGLFDDLPPLDTEPSTPPSSRRRRVVPFVLLLAFIAIAADSTFSLVHVPWLLVAVVGVFLWRRSGWHRHAHSEIER